MSEMNSIKSTNAFFKDLTGKRFERLEVIRYAGRSSRGNSLWECRCDCGGTTTTQTKNLTIGKAKSCGCLQKERLKLGRGNGCVFHADGRIELAGGHVCLVDPADIPLLSQCNWTVSKSRENIFYAKRANPHGLMHVILMGRKGVDHKNGNGLDNRRSNLRFATIQQNNFNQKKRTGAKSNYKGVVPPKARLKSKYWRFKVTINGKQKEFGKYATEIEAAREYDKKAKEAYGEFARLNFPEDSQ